MQKAKVKPACRQAGVKVKINKGKSPHRLFREPEGV